MLEKKLANKLNIFIPKISMIDNNINMQIQKFCENYFNRIN